MSDENQTPITPYELDINPLRLLLEAVAQRLGIVGFSFTYTYRNPDGKSLHTSAMTLLPNLNTDVPEDRALLRSIVDALAKSGSDHTVNAYEQQIAAQAVAKAQQASAEAVEPVTETPAES